MLSLGEKAAGPKEPQSNLLSSCCMSAHNRTTRLALIFSSFHILFPILFFSFSHTEVAGTVLSFISVVFSPFFSKFFDRNTQEASGLSPLLAVACLEGGQNDL